MIGTNVDPLLTTNNTHAIFVGGVNTGLDVELNALGDSGTLVVPQSGVVFFNGSSSFGSLASRSIGLTITDSLLLGGASITTAGDLSLASNQDGIDTLASFRGDAILIRDGTTLDAGGSITLASEFGTPGWGDDVWQFGGFPERRSGERYCTSDDHCRRRCDV